MAAYYNNEGVDYAKVEIYIVGVVLPGTYRFALAKDGMSISWQRGIDNQCRNKNCIRSVMQEKFSSHPPASLPKTMQRRRCTTTRCLQTQGGNSGGALKSFSSRKRARGPHLT